MRELFETIGEAIDDAVHFIAHVFGVFVVILLFAVIGTFVFVGLNWLFTH